MNEKSIAQRMLAQAALFGARSETLAVGDSAPNFILPGSDGASYRLEDYKGNQPVVLAWFPRAFTPG